MTIFSLSSEGRKAVVRIEKSLLEKECRRQRSQVKLCTACQPEDESVVDVLQDFLSGLDWAQLEESGDVDQDAEGEDCQHRRPLEEDAIIVQARL